MPIPEMHLKALRILIADDNQLNCKIVSAMLERRGHSAAVVHNGKEVVSALLHAPYDAVVMDIAMPEMDGVQATEAVRASVTDRVDASIPIVALTAHYMEADRERYIKAGMDAFLAKPVRINALLKTIYDVLVRKGKDVHAVAEEDAAYDKRGQMRDLALIFSEFGLDRDDVFALYELMYESLPREYSALKVSVREGWLEEAADMAHFLAGSALDIVVDGPALLAREIEHAARNGDLAEVEHLCAEMDPQIGYVYQQLCHLLGKSGP